MYSTGARSGIRHLPCRQSRNARASAQDNTTSGWGDIASCRDLAHEELGRRADLHWSVPDPARTRTDAAFDAAYHELTRRVADLASRLRPASWYADGRVASLAVTAFLQKTAVEQGPDHRREVLRQELERLDALQFAYWPAAVNGDHNAANIVLKCIARRCTVLGFDRADNRIATTASVVVIRGTEEEYVNGLQAVIDQQERGHRQTPGELGGR